MTKLGLLALLIFLQATLTAQSKFELEPFGGLYQGEKAELYLLNPVKGFPHFVVMKTGETHVLRQKRENSFEFTSTRNSWKAVGGIVEFDKKNFKLKMCIHYAGKERKCAKAVKTRVRESMIKLGNESLISGVLIEPQNPRSNLVAVLLHGDGDNDRYDLFDAGMYLVSKGFSVFAFDKRNAGKSTGSEAKGNNYDEISRHYADDAARLISKLRKLYPDKRFGVLGGSQGGWIGSIVSDSVPDLAFYINIAGNISIGWQQWQHYMISYLKRNGFNKEEVAEAEDYFKAFFDVGKEKIKFADYQSKLGRYENRAWLKRLEKRKLVKWKDKAAAIRVVKNNSNNPVEDVIRVSAPALGIFFQFDHSTPPDSPALFVKSLTESKSNDFSVRVFPNTTHGGWVVNSYYFDSSKITRMEPKVYQFIADWLASI